jgi:hypothetical protein
MLTATNTEANNKKEWKSKKQFKMKSKNETHLLWVISIIFCYELAEPEEPIRTEVQKQRTPNY